MTKAQMQAQFDRCFGPAPKPYVRPKLTGIEKELRLQEVKQVASWKSVREEVKA